MALGGHELLLIVRAQNQASQALRRVAADTARLSSIRDLHLRQNQLAISQAKSLTTRQRALNELASIEGAQGARNLSLSRRQISNRAQQLAQMNLLEKAQMRYQKVAQMGVTGRPLVMAGRDVERYQKSLRAAQVGAQQLSAEQIRLADRAKILRREIETANAALSQNAIEQRQIAKAIRIQRWDRFQTGARIVTHLGRVLQMAGLVGGAALGFLAHGAAQWNSEVTLAATQTGKLGTTAVTVAKNSKFLQTALLGVMKQSTATRQDITASAYDIYSSLSISLKGGIKLLHLFAKASIAGMTPLKDVTAASIHVMNAFRIPVNQMPRAINRMFAAVRFGRMTFKDFTGTLATMTPAFAAAGQSFDQMTGALAFMTRMIPNVRMSSIGLARLVEMFGRKDFTEGLKTFGVRITDAHNRLLPFSNIIDILIKRFPKLQQGGTYLQNFFKMVTAATGGRGLTGTIQARRVFAPLVLHAGYYREILAKTIGDQNEFSRSLTAMSKTGEVRWKMFLNNLKAFAIQLGEAVLPALLKLTKPLQNLAKWFENLDSKQKSQIGRFATYAAAILLVGGTVVSVGAMILSFVAVLGKFGIAGSGIAVILLGIVAAVKVLRGDWQSLSDAVTSGADTMTGSIKGFVAMSALLVVAALRIRKAATAIAGAQVVAGAGGLMRGGGGAIATGRLAAMYKAEQGASRLSAMLTGAGAAAVALPGPLKIAAAAIGLGAAAAGLWELHMRGVREHAERIAKFQAQVAAIAGAPAAGVRRLAGLGQDVREVVRQRNAVADLNAQIRQTRKDVVAASAAERPGLQRQLTDLILQRADAQDSLDVANARANRSFAGMSDAFTKQVNLLQALGNAHRNLRRDQQQLLDMRIGVSAGAGEATAYYRGQADTVNRLREATKNYRYEIDKLAPAANRNAIALRNAFVRTVRDLQRIEILPKKVSPVAIDAMFRTALRRGRMLTIPEMKAVIRAVVDPASLRKLPRDIQAAVRAARIQVRMEADQAATRKKVFSFIKKVGGLIPGIPVLAKTDLQQAHQSKSKIASVFKKAINQPIHLGPVQPNAVALGASIAQGVASGISGNAGSINSAIVGAVNAAIAAGVHAAKAHSPSRETRDRIGVPLAEGIVQGVLSQLPDIERSSRLAVDFFNGPWLTSDKFTQAKKKVHIHVRDLIKDLQMQVRQMQVFNRSLETLAKRGVPLLLLDQLSQLGVEGANKIAKLANASQKQLNRYVAIWRKAMREIQRSTRSNFDTIVSDLHSFIEQAAQNLLAKWNEIHDGLQSVWGDIFTGFDDLVGEGFKNAMESWQNNVTDLKNQIVDLNNQILDIQDQMRQKITDEFGKLFEGAYLASEQVQTRLQWGQVLNMDDLTRDLQSQVDAFNQWRTNLIKLANRVPAEMLKELTDLGPDAAKQIAILAGATGPELAKYIQLWQQKQAAIKKATGDILPDKDEFKKQITDLVKQIAGLQKQLIDAMTQKPKALTAQDMLEQLHKKMIELMASQNLINTLRKKGLPAELLAQLAQLGPEALPLLGALNSMTKSQLKEYIKTWTQMQASINKETSKLMQDQIKLWEKHGADIAAGIIAGILSEQEALLKFFRHLFMQLLKAARKETKSNSPSKTFQALGMDMISGLAMGLATGDGMTIPMPGLGNAFKRGGGYGRDDTRPINMTVHAHHDETLMSTLERASFRLRNRKV